MSLDHLDDGDRGMQPREGSPARRELLVRVAGVAEVEIERQPGAEDPRLQLPRLGQSVVLIALAQERPSRTTRRMPPGASRGRRRVPSSLSDDNYAELVRHAEAALEGKERAKQPRVKEALVVQREFFNIRLESEDVAEFEYQPSKAKKAYRMVVVRKNLIEQRGQLQLCANVRYFFYVTTTEPRLLAFRPRLHILPRLLNAL